MRVSGAVSCEAHDVTILVVMLSGPEAFFFKFNLANSRLTSASTTGDIKKSVVDFVLKIVCEMSSWWFNFGADFTTYCAKIIVDPIGNIFIVSQSFSVHDEFLQFSLLFPFVRIKCCSIGFPEVCCSRLFLIYQVYIIWIFRVLQTST